MTAKKGTRLAWAAAAGLIAVGLAIALWPPATETKANIVGVVLQLCGILCVIGGISITRSEFGLPSFVSVILSHLKRLNPFRSKRVNVGIGNGVMAACTGKARAHQSKPARPDAPIEERIADLEANIDLIHQRITGVQHEIDFEESARTAAIAIERTGREAEDRSIREKLQAASMGGIHISAIGAAFLFFGVLLSGFSLWLR